ncbi:MAG: protein translocase subunit SecF [Deltaproteobacteria bacterium]|nr:protein translocase subunit SecF [Deltaproteobacteria bacterium]
MELIKHGTRIDFMRQRRFWITVSMVLATVSLILSFMPPGAMTRLGPLTVGLGPNYGTDFRGGTELEVKFKKSVDAGTVRAAVEAIPGFSRPDVVAVGNPGEARFLIRVQEHSSLDENKMREVRGALCNQGGTNDAKGTFVPDPPLDPAKCPEGAARPTEVKFSPGGDKVAVRYELKPDDALIQKIKDAITAVPGVDLRGAVDEKGQNVDISVKGKEAAQATEYRVEVQLKSKGDLLLDKLRDQLGADTVPMAADKVEWVGPRAGKQLRDAAIKSVLFAIIFIMAYVAFRFDLRFAPGGILALFHDAIVVIGVFILLRREITLSTIAAVLTIVGYSISDTVIIYDRIRENLNKHRGVTFHEIINLSVSETLSRTILTSTSVLLSVAGMFIWGTGPLKDFALALFVGVIAGTYSSIFVAAPLTEWIDRRFFGGTAAQKKKGARKKAGTGPGGAKHQVQHQV